MKVLIDMNLSPLWVEFFADAGVESVHWRDIGNPTAADSEIMDYASANSFVVFTHDLDFGALLVRRQAALPSVVQVRTEDILPDAIGALVIQAFTASRDHLAAGALVTVDVKRCRIRMLPIGPST